MRLVQRSHFATLSRISSKIGCITVPNGRNGVIDTGLDAVLSDTSSWKDQSEIIYKADSKERSHIKGRRVNFSFI